MTEDARAYTPGKFNKPKYVVKKRNTHTCEEEVVFESVTSLDEAEAKRREFEADLTPEQKEKIEYICEPTPVPTYRTFVYPD